MTNPCPKCQSPHVISLRSFLDSFKTPVHEVRRFTIAHDDQVCKDCFYMFNAQECRQHHSLPKTIKKPDGRKLRYKENTKVIKQKLNPWTSKLHRLMAEKNITLEDLSLKSGLKKKRLKSLYEGDVPKECEFKALARGLNVLTDFLVLRDRKKTKGN